MRTVCLLSLLTVVLTSPLIAQPEPQSEEDKTPLPDVSLDLTVVSVYFFRGDTFNGYVTEDGKPSLLGPALQPSASIKLPAGLSFGLWSSFVLTNRFVSDVVSGRG